MALSWQTLEQTLVTWATSASGLAADRVRWGLQSAPAPARPFLTLTWGARDVPAGNEVRDEARPGTGAGDLVRVHFRTHTLSLQYFAAVPTSAAGASGHASAAVGALLRSLQTEATRAALLAGGLRVVSIGPIHDLSALLETGYETRATADLEFITADTTTEQVGAISTVTAPAGTVT